MREALAKRSSSQRPSKSASRATALKSKTSSKKKASTGRTHSRSLIQAKSKGKASAQKAASKSVAASRKVRASRGSKTASSVRPSKLARAKKPGKLSASKATKALKSAKSSRLTKLSKPKAAVRSAKAARGTIRQRATVKSTQKSAKPGRVFVPAYVERVVPLETPRRKPASGALKAFEHAVRVFNKRQFGEARELFDMVQRKFPQEVEIVARSHTYIQVCSQRMQRPPTSPKSADELYDRGVFHLNIGNFVQARQYFEKALRLNPDEPDVLYSLAASHARSGTHDEALTFLDQLIQEHPRFRTQALNDSDFSDLHENKRFLEILGVSSLLDIIDSRREP